MINLIQARDYTPEEEAEFKAICAEVDQMMREGGFRIGGLTLGENADKLGVARDVLASLKEIAAGDTKPLLFGDSKHVDEGRDET